MTVDVQSMPQTQTALPESRRFRITRQGVLSVSFLIIGILMLVGSYDSHTPDTRTILTFEPGVPENVTHVVIPTLNFLAFTSFLFIAAGVTNLLSQQNLNSIASTLIVVAILNEVADLGISTAIFLLFIAVIFWSARATPGNKKRIAFWLLVASGVLIVPAMLVAAAAESRTNATTMFSESLRLATPIALGAMAGLWCERSGVINIAIEGMMLFAACFGFVTLFYLRDVWPDHTNWVLFISVMVGILTGGIVALLHAWLSITFKTDQIVSGTVINILAVGVTSFVRREYLLSSEAGTVSLKPIEIPLLSDIPIIGEPLFASKPIFYLMFVVIVVSHVVLFYSRWGLRTRAVGEHPHAADTLGINVNRTRWINVFIAGLIAGLAGAWFSLEAVGRFNDNMTHGSGFIALAAMIFGKWTPFGAFGGAMLFGFSDALGTRFQTLNVAVPVQFLQMVPYVVTMVVLAGIIGRARAPKAIGKPYEKE